MAKIHPTAIVDSKVEMGADVIVGAYCIIKGAVRIGEGTCIDEHSIIHGRTIIGSGCRIGPAAYVGMDPQDLKYSGEPTSLIIGDSVIIRETATIHRSTHSGADHATRIGDRTMMMAAAHVAHDCRVGKDVIMANGVLLGGHVEVADRAFLGGAFVLHQFCRVGRLAVIAGNEAISQDVPPFAAVRDRSLKGYNAIGCKRAGMTQETVVAIRGAFRQLRKHRNVGEALKAIGADASEVPEVAELVEFIESSKRGIVPTLLSLKQRAFGGKPQDGESD